MRPSLGRTSRQIPASLSGTPPHAPQVLWPHPPFHSGGGEEQPSRGTSAGVSLLFPFGSACEAGSPPSYTPKWRGKAQPRIGGSSVPYIHIGSLYTPDAGLDIPFAHSFNNAWPGTLILP